MNGDLISRGCSHVLIQYFPLIVRVHTRANVNKMLTEKKDRCHEGQFQVREKAKYLPFETRKIGDLGSSAFTSLLIYPFHIILYMRKVVKAKSDAFPLRAAFTRFTNTRTAILVRCNSPSEVPASYNTTRN